MIKSNIIYHIFLKYVIDATFWKKFIHRINIIKRKKKATEVL